MNTPDRILDAAREEIARTGYADLSMRRVARRVGISAPAIYRHFDGKEALLSHLCGEAAGRFERCLRRGLGGADPLRRFTEAGEGYIDFAVGWPSDYRLIFTQPHPGFHALRAASQASFSPNFQLLLDRVNECLLAGVFDGGDPREIAMTAWAHAHGLCILYLDCRLQGMDEATFRALATASMARLVRGFGA